MKSRALHKYKNLRFKKLSVKNGLSTDNIYNVFEDFRGFIWFTTMDGLNRYDGRRFKIYKNEVNNKRSIGKGFIIPVIEDKDKIMWIGTIKGGLCRYVRETDDFIRYTNDPEDPFSISDDFVTGLIEDEDGIIWVGTQSGVLNKFDKSSGKFIPYKYVKGDDSSLSGTVIMTMHIDRKKNLWVATDCGINLFDSAAGKFKRYTHDPNNPDGISCNDVRTIYEDKNGEIWFGTNGGGLNKFDQSTETFKHYRHDINNPGSSCIDHVYDMREDDSGIVWLASHAHKVQCMFDPSTEEFFCYENNPDDKNSINDCGVYRVIKDSAGAMWLCTVGQGVCYYNYNNWKFEYYFSAAEKTGAMCEDKKGHLWISSAEGINVFTKDLKNVNKEFGNQDFLKTLRSDDELKMICDMEGKIWISHGREGLLDMYDYEKNEFKRFDNGTKRFITCIYEDKEGLLWVTYFKLIIKVFNKERNSWKTYRCSNKEPSPLDMYTYYSIMEDNDSKIWLGSYGKGISIINKKTGEFTFIMNNPDDENSLNLSSILNPIYQCKNGIIWIGTLEHGIDKLDPKQNKFTHYTTEQGLISNEIHGILEDDHGNLWISTNKGLSKFNPETEEFHNFDTNDGLQSGFSMGSALKTSDGKMYFGSGNGMNGFYPDSIKENKRIPKIVLTGFKIFNKDAKLDTSVTEAAEINLSYKENFFSIEYAALDYVNPGKNQYAYKLEGVDKNWNYTGNNNSVSYTNISPGKYTFRVKGSNNDGVWNEEGASVKIIIIPPFHKTVLFKGLSALSLICGIGMIFRQRFEKIKKEKERQEEFTRKIIESQENERKRFASDLHDGLGQDLIIIKNKAEISADRTEDVLKLKEELKEISELASSTINEARKISQNLRPSILDALGLTRTLLSMIERAANSTSINFKHEIENIDNVFARETDINVYRILQECLTNIIKHSSATEVFVYIKKSDKNILIVIEDNGKGFDVRKKLADAENKGFGLKGIPERVKLFGGIFRINSEPGKGTVIKISLPVKS